MLKLLTLMAIVFTFAGCQQSNGWLQNGGLPMRVPPPPTGSYQVPNQYTPQ